MGLNPNLCHGRRKWGKCDLLLGGLMHKVPLLSKQLIVLLLLHHPNAFLDWAVKRSVIGPPALLRALANILQNLVQHVHLLPTISPNIVTNTHANLFIFKG